eukprot:GILK01020827.1.p1 GENE.GILK01020827.1~~GILK01020827.1.p1  ORF type:complete len:247 (-),score=1.81 GILK01020827.1:35-775(-)
MGRDFNTSEGLSLGYGKRDEHSRAGVMKPMTPGHILNNMVPNEEGYHQKPLTNLPGVKNASDLPADPITRLFFQTKGDYALYNQTFEDPANTDPDRIELLRRDDTRLKHRQQYTTIYDFCHRIREASEQKKRFVIIPATHETKGAAQVLFDHGMVAGFRDFHNDRAFAIELKYFQNDPVIQIIEPAAVDRQVEYLWSLKMMRRLTSSFGISNRIRIFIVRTHDGRIVDHIQASQENIGGYGLLMAY